MKQCQSNPWEEFSMTHNKGDKVSGSIKSITDFGIFIGLDGGIDGLIHLSDITWEDENEEVVRDFKKGDDLEAVVLAIDPERERISLGVKQLQDDPFSEYLSQNPRGTVVTGKVTEVDASGAKIELAEGVEGYIRAADISRERTDDASKVLSVGDDVEAKFTGTSRKDRTLTLSIKAKDSQEETEAVKEYSNGEDGSNTTLGDLLKEQMDQK
tara:strand:- start:225 stop:860 length:636 start_codon:yes stop_codon:yes gene_type:complete